MHKKEREVNSDRRCGHEILENQSALAMGLLKGLPTGFSSGCLKTHFHDLQTSLPFL